MLWGPWLNPAAIRSAPRTHTRTEHVQQIVGKTADPNLIQRIIYFALTHDPRILLIDTCHMYSAGSNFFVEVDIVLPRDMPLHEAHDIGEALQFRLEELPHVERAFVHVDHEVTHKVGGAHVCVRACVCMCMCMGSRAHRPCTPAQPEHRGISPIVPTSPSM
jgi:hypothetical protein